MALDETSEDEATSLPVVVETTEEGAKFREAELPIDISYTKLAEWLEDRKKVPSDWRKRLAAIQSRVGKLLEKLPRGAHPSFPALSQETVSFLEAKHVRQVLSALYPEARTVFRTLSGLPGEWDAVVRAYEKDNIFLGEGALILVTNANYEIPYLKKQVGRIQQHISDSERKEVEQKRAAVAATQKYKQACEEIEIEGNDIRKELKALVKKLPEVFGQVVEATKSDSIGQAVEYYREFVKFAHLEADSGENKNKSVMHNPPMDNSLPEVLPALCSLRETSWKPPPADQAAEDYTAAEEFLKFTSHTTQGQEKTTEELTSDRHEKGNLVSVTEGIATVGEAIKEEVGEKEAEARLDFTEENEGSPQINWDLDLSTMTMVSDDGPADENSANEGVQGGIVWDIGEIAVEDGMGGERGVEIDWAIDLEDSGTNEGVPGGIVWDIGDAVDEEGKGGEGGVGKEGIEERPDVDGPLADSEFRNRLLDDLFELHAFLRQRVRELSSHDHSSIQQQLLMSAPAVVQQHPSSSLLILDSEVQNAINLLTCRRTRDLLLILSSPRFVERLVETLEQKKTSGKRISDSSTELQEKRRDLRNSLNATWPKLTEVVERTKSVKREVERALSVQYGGRPVNIIGEINNLIAS